MHGGAVIHSSHHEEDAHEPAAAGSRTAELITTTLLMISMILSWIAFVDVGFAHHDMRVPIFTWMTAGDLKVEWSLRIDTLTAVMLVVVNTVSAFVHLYSIGYMHEDPYRPRFFGYLSMFTFAMLMLVTADNLVQLFFGWEGVGLASYLLIGFWYHKPEANAAAIKAFIVNRVGDFGFALGIFAVFMLTGAIDFDTVFAQAPSLTGKTINFFGWQADALTLTCLFLFMGAMGKSAQFLLHTWLPDAMEGPTPVSALIHAATMVTAGVFMVARLSPLFELAPQRADFRDADRRHHRDCSPPPSASCRTTSSASSLIRPARSSATCSWRWEWGPIRSACSISFTHAFFKALLFLGSGSVIHRDASRAGHPQHGRAEGSHSVHLHRDAHRHAGADRLPAHRRLFLQGRRSSRRPSSARIRWRSMRFICTVAAALLTSFYSWRLIFKTFHGEPHDRKHWRDAHESPMVMLIPLGFLAAGSVLAGLPFKEIFAGHGVEGFFRESLAFAKSNHVLEDMHHVPLQIGILPTVMMVVGFVIAWHFYIRRPDIPVELARQHDWLYRFLLNKWYFDELYDLIFVRPTKWLGRLLWKSGDGWLIDGFGPDGVSARVLDVTRNVVRLQTGYLYHYAFAMLIGAAAFITWFMFATGTH